MIKPYNPRSKSSFIWLFGLCIVAGFSILLNKLFLLSLLILPTIYCSLWLIFIGCSSIISKQIWVAAHTQIGYSKKVSGLEAIIYGLIALLFGIAFLIAGWIIFL